VRLAYLQAMASHALSGVQAHASALDRYNRTDVEKIR